MRQFVFVSILLFTALTYTTDATAGKRALEDDDNRTRKKTKYTPGPVQWENINDDSIVYIAGYLDPLSLSRFVRVDKRGQRILPRLQKPVVFGDAFLEEIKAKLAQRWGEDDIIEDICYRLPYSRLRCLGAEDDWSNLSNILIQQKNAFDASLKTSSGECALELLKSYNAYIKAREQGPKGKDVQDLKDLFIEKTPERYQALSNLYPYILLGRITQSIIAFLPIIDQREKKSIEWAYDPCELSGMFRAYLTHEQYSISIVQAGKYFVPRICKFPFVARNFMFPLSLAFWKEKVMRTLIQLDCKGSECDDRFREVVYESVDLLTKYWVENYSEVHLVHEKLTYWQIPEDMLSWLSEILKSQPETMQLNQGKKSSAIKGIINLAMFNLIENTYGAEPKFAENNYREKYFHYTNKLKLFLHSEAEREEKIRIVKKVVEYFREEEKLSTHPDQQAQAYKFADTTLQDMVALLSSETEKATAYVEAARYYETIAEDLCKTKQDKSNAYARGVQYYVEAASLWTDSNKKAANYYHAGLALYAKLRFSDSKRVQKIADYERAAQYCVEAAGLYTDATERDDSYYNAGVAMTELASLLDSKTEREQKIKAYEKAEKYYILSMKDPEFWSNRDVYNKLAKATQEKADLFNLDTEREQKKKKKAEEQAKKYVALEREELMKAAEWNVKALRNIWRPGKDICRNNAIQALEEAIKLFSTETETEVAEMRKAQELLKKMRDEKEQINALWLSFAGDR